MSPVLDKACRDAWEMLMANLSMTCAEVAAEKGLCATTFSGWTRRKHPGELQALRSKAGMKLYGKSNPSKPL